MSPPPHIPDCHEVMKSEYLIQRLLRSFDLYRCLLLHPTIFASNITQQNKTKSNQHTLHGLCGIGNSEGMEWIGILAGITWEDNILIITRHGLESKPPNIPPNLDTHSSKRATNGHSLHIHFNTFISSMGLFQGRKHSTGLGIGARELGICDCD